MDEELQVEAVVVLEIGVRLTGGNMAQYLEMVTAFLGPAFTEDGYLGCRLYQDLNQTSRVVLSLEWQDEERLRRLIQGRRFRTFLVALDLSSTRPRLVISRLKYRRVITTMQDLLLNLVGLVNMGRAA